MNEQTPEVGFYHLQRVALERALPKLLEKVLEQGRRAVVLAGSRERVEDLNGLLWTYEERSWLPHGGPGDGHAEAQPIYLTTEEENPNGADVLVAIDGMQPGYVASFARVADMFDGRDQHALAAARERWKLYKSKNYPVTYWQQTEGGGWQKQA